jgi:lactate permease
MFAAAQAEAARGLDLPPLRLVAVQNVSASLLTMASVPRVALVAGLLGGVGTQPVRRLLLVDAAALLVLGLLAFTAFG